MNKYQLLLDELTKTSNRLTSKDRRISAIRLLCLTSSVLLAYQYFQQSQLGWLVGAILAATAFGLVIRQHLQLRWHNRFVQEKIEINKSEIDFLNGDASGFKDGKEFLQHDHPYSYDLDFFGAHSLYQSLNRTHTVAGKEALANALLHIQSNEEISSTQAAIQELTPNLEWRQSLSALARMNPDSTESYDELMAWSQKPPISIHPMVRLLSFVMPAMTLLCFCYYLIAGSGVAGNLSGLFFLANLGVLGLYTQAIKSELVDTTKVEKILKQYALMFTEIEGQSFTSQKLKALQNQLRNEESKASGAIHQLALLFGRMEHVANVFASPLLNGSLLFHLHVLHQLSSWRKKHALHIREWLEVLGQFEMLSSLANFSYNNPAHTFPSLNTNFQIKFEALGHPLLPQDKAVTNSIDFTKQRFFVLTGSNMSGKSTFLRTVGVNMILAGIGAPVFAKSATFHPLPVHVSMRLSDSLTDSESYFYAEVKRLKAIMEELDKGPCFVLLDEILRGTNSDDKRNGTVEVIRKMATYHAIGGIATHDLEVCKTTEDYADILANKRFEVEIVDDELLFDYTLRDGICKNKSASFIMKKMGVI